MTLGFSHVNGDNYRVDLRIKCGSDLEMLAPADGYMHNFSMRLLHTAHRKSDWEGGSSCTQACIPPEIPGPAFLPKGTLAPICPLHRAVRKMIVKGITKPEAVHVYNRSSSGSIYRAGPSQHGPQLPHEKLKTAILLFQPDTHTCLGTTLYPCTKQDGRAELKRDSDNTI